MTRSVSRAMLLAMTPATTELHQFLVERAHPRTGLNYGCAEDLILDRGVWFTSRELSSTQRSIVIAAAERAGEQIVPNHCFANAARLVMADRSGELSYYEGFAAGHVMPVHHAWCVIGGKVIDLTWKRRDLMQVRQHPWSEYVLGEFGPSHAYIGMPFDHQVLVERLSSGADNLSILDHPTSSRTVLATPRSAKASTG